MSETTYTIEHAKSGRSKCKRCKQPIVKGALRIGVCVKATDEGGFDMTSYNHVDCFRMPRKFVNGPLQMTVEEFFQDMVTDISDDNDILPDKLDDLVSRVETAMATTTKKTAKKAKKETDETTIMGRLKQAVENEEKDEKPSKKQKKDGGYNEGDYDKMLSLYKEHRKKKADDLKDYLRWNRQVLKGTKEFVLFKVLDGFVHGRLGYCGLCGGTLKFNDDDYEEYVYCNGRFDEDTNTRLPCDYKGERLNCPRLQPWYSEAPTEEQAEEMDKLKEAAQEGGGGGFASNEDNPEVQSLLKQAAKFDWDLTDRSGIQKATNDLVALVGKAKIDLPSNKTPKQVLGPLVVANKDSTPEDIVKVVVEKYGLAEQKEKKAAAKEAAAEAVCANPKNAALLMAFKELAELYFKEGNRNAGASYTKVASAIKDMSAEITADNAMGFSKGKTKVPGIGKSSAEKMKEFCATGTIEKLEEKRAANA